MSWVNSVLRQFLPNGPKGRTVGRKVPATHHSRPEGSGRQAVSVSWGGYLPGETTVTAETNARRYESTDSSLLTPGLDYTRLFISLTAAAGTICISVAAGRTTERQHHANRTFTYIINSRSTVDDLVLYDYRLCYEIVSSFFPQESIRL